MVPTSQPSYLDASTSDLVSMRLAGMTLEAIAERLDAPLVWVRMAEAQPAFRAELVARRRAVLERVGDAAAMVVTKGLEVVQDGMERDPEDTTLALGAIRAAGALLPKTLELAVRTPEEAAGDELRDDVAWLLQQAAEHAAVLEHGAAAVLDAEWVENDEAPPPGEGDGADGWDLL